MIDPLTPADVAMAGHLADFPVIERASGDPEPALRLVALGSFHRLGALDPERLQGFLTDSDPTVRRRAVELAARIDARTAMSEALIERLDDDHDMVAEMAAFSLGEIGDTAAVPKLAHMALEHAEPLCREAAVAALGALHAGKDTILAALEDKATVRRRAVIALAPFDGPDVDAALQRALTDRDWQVRQAAEDLLA